MRETIESIQLSAEVQSRAAHFADLEGISLEQWISEAVSSKIETAEFFHKRVKPAGSLSLPELLDKAPDRPPDPGDEL